MIKLTIEQWTVKVTPNRSKRTFTIRFINPNTNKCLAKYRTNRLAQIPFEYIELFYTKGDWNKYISNSNSDNWNAIY